MTLTREERKIAVSTCCLCVATPTVTPHHPSSVLPTVGTAQRPPSSTRPELSQLRVCVCVLYLPVLRVHVCVLPVQVSLPASSGGRGVLDTGHARPVTHSNRSRQHTCTPYTLRGGLTETTGKKQKRILNRGGWSF